MFKMEQRENSWKVSSVESLESDISSNIKVFVRARPPEDVSTVTDFIEVTHDEKSTVILTDPDNSNTSSKKNLEYQFDKVFWTDTTQEDIFNRICKPQVHIFQVIHFARN